MSKPGFIQTVLMGMVLMFSTGCATIMNGSDSPYPISTSPAGVKVSVNGLNTGVTPVQVIMDRGRAHMVRFEKDGCPTFDTMVSSKISPWFFGNFIIGGIIGLVVDMSTGAMYDLNPNSLLVVYEESKDGKCTLSSPYTVQVVPMQEPPKKQVVQSGYTPYRENESR